MGPEGERRDKAIPTSMWCLGVEFFPKSLSSIPLLLPDGFVVAPQLRPGALAQKGRETQLFGLWEGLEDAHLLEGKEQSLVTFYSSSSSMRPSRDG